ncbi:hypothetical protein [Pseudoflavonifractor sp. 60]|uniref:hypothetical protein n=1 Tax=Pseudoflavonifractor sp. 60 TaxID=2304576 RepID=UPI00136C8F7E|nr:hypothetical protein [Pseudoflavonifractor sp. 60]
MKEVTAKLLLPIIQLAVGCLGALLLADGISDPSLFSRISPALVVALTGMGTFLGIKGIVKVLNEKNNKGGVYHGKRS